MSDITFTNINVSLRQLFDIQTNHKENVLPRISLSVLSSDSPSHK